MNLFPYAISNALGWTILHSLWQGMLIAIFAAVVLLFMRHQPAQWRYRVTGLAMLLLLLTSVATFYWYTQQDARTLAENASAMAPADATDAPPTTTDITAATAPDSTATTATQSNVLGTFIQRAGAYFEPHLSLIALMWCFGFGAYLLRLLGNIGQVYYLKKQRNFPADEYWADIKNQLLQKAGLRTAVELVESTLVRTPLVVGHIKPYIMFPIGLINRLDPFEVEAIIAHEIAHIVRRDYLFNILQSLVETLFYYHPAVWWMSGEMRREREIAADDMAIALTGNAVNYAKALVVVQELAYFPMSTALAFAGNRKSQLFTRIQNILKTNHSKYFAMEKFISAGVFLLLMVGLALAQTGSNATPPSFEQKQWNKPTFTAADSMKGIWVAEMENGKLCLTLTQKSNRNFWNNSDCYELSAFSPLPNGKGSFSMTREAGTIVFDGEFDGKEGYGKFTFNVNPQFKKTLDTKKIGGVDDNFYIHFCLHNITGEYIDFVRSKGFNNVNGDDLVGLAVHGLDQREIETYLNLFAKKGQKNVDIEDLMAFKIHGITEAYINEISNIGFKNLSLEEIMSAKIHGIDAAFVQECTKMGFKNLDFDEVLSMKIHDISPDYLADLKKAGVENLSFEDVLSYKIHGIDADYLLNLKKSGFNINDHDAVLSKKIHNITPEYAASLKAAGFDLDESDMMAWKIHDVTPEYAKAMKAAGFDLNVQEVLSWKIHDVTPEYANSLKAAGFNLDVQEVLTWKIHDITPETIKEYQKLGFKNLTGDDILSFKIHGVDAEFINGFKKIGFNNIAPDDVVALRIHDVTPEFIEKARKNGFDNMTIDEYVQLKIQFGNKIRQ